MIFVAIYNSTIILFNKQFYNLKYFPITNFDKEANNTVSNY